MKSIRLLFAMLIIVLSGCGAYELQPLQMNHPANAQAMAAPAVSRSDTLAYDRADIPAVSGTAAAKHEMPSDPAAAQFNGQKTVVGEGKVIATVPNANQLVIEHGEIKGFMDAMTMGYRIEPPSLLEGLKSGDQVRFIIDVLKKTIVKIEKMK
jgi:Cu/Ag efflux protein CusF